MDNQPQQAQKEQTETPRREYSKPILVKEEGWSKLTGFVVSGGG